MVGGRRYDFQSNQWKYQTEARVYNKRDNLWRTLQPLPLPIADACLLVLNSNLIFSGGAKARHSYAHDPESKSKILTLNVSDSAGDWSSQKFPAMLGNRKWHGCTMANINDEVKDLNFTDFITKIVNF